MMKGDILEDKSKALIKAASVNVEPFWPVCKDSDPCQHWDLPGAGAKPASYPTPSSTAEKNVLEESAGDMGFGLFD